MHVQHASERLDADVFYRAAGAYGDSPAGQDEVSMSEMYERLRGEIENLESAGADERTLQEAEKMLYMKMMAASGAQHEEMRQYMAASKAEKMMDLMD